MREYSEIKSIITAGSFILGVGIIPADEVEWKDSANEICKPYADLETGAGAWVPSIARISSPKLSPFPKLNVGQFHLSDQNYVSLLPLPRYLVLKSKGHELPHIA